MSEKLQYRDHFFPNCEVLAPDEMRITALGTGRPFLRKAQANAGWFIELGNGDKFMFDFGFGTQLNFAALEIPYNAITAIFATHLHTDHVGDFMQVRQGGWSGGRTTPLQIYGPSGVIPEHGTRYFVENQVRSFRWDADTRHGLLPLVGSEIEVHEFDFSKVQLIYEKNGVRIVSFPAVHIFDGPVSLRLEWNGLVFVYSGDTVPSRFMLEHAQNSDILVHETFDRYQVMMEKAGYDEKTARAVCMAAHSDPAEVGHVFAKLRPRLAVGYHFYNDTETLPAHIAAVRQEYDGPLEFARDLMVFNVTKQQIKTRMTIVSMETWPNKEFHGEGFRKLPRGERLKMSSWLTDEILFPKI
jgi:ribonuclease Z